MAWLMCCHVHGLGAQRIGCCPSRASHTARPVEHSLTNLVKFWSVSRRSGAGQGEPAAVRAGKAAVLPPFPGWGIRGEGSGGL